jgi:hypothetical protein
MALGILVPPAIVLHTVWALIVEDGEPFPARLTHALNANMFTDAAPNREALYHFAWDVVKHIDEEPVRSLKAYVLCALMTWMRLVNFPASSKLLRTLRGVAERFADHGCTVAASHVSAFIAAADADPTYIQTDFLEFDTSVRAFLEHTK